MFCGLSPREFGLIRQTSDQKEADRSELNLLFLPAISFFYHTL